MCFGLDIFGTGKAAKNQAKALEEQARQERLLAQASQQNLENQIARQKAAEDARALLEKPMETTSVTVGEQEDAATVDETGRRRTNRSKFQVTRPSGAGLGGL